MNSRESEFFKKLMETFREEASEHLNAISKGLLELEKKPPANIRHQHIETIFREAHSLKGAARSVNQQTILEICQNLETVLSLWKQGKIELSSCSFDILHTTINVISKALSEALDPSITLNTVQQLNALSENSTNQSTTENQSLEKTSKTDANILPIANQQTQAKSIRISIEKINQFFQETEETLMIKVLFKTQLDHLKRFQTDLCAQEKSLGLLIMELQVLRQAVQGSSYNTVIEFINSLENQLHELKSTRENVGSLLKNAEQNAHIVEITVDKLLEDLKKILMQPMSMLFETLPHMIRDLSRELSKEVHVEFQGEDIEVDRRVLEEIKDPLIHLIRNSIDHGIETPQERIRQNKPSLGTIRISAAECEGNKVKLSISDDGHGIDLAKVKQVSLKKGLISQKDLESMTEEEAIKLAFLSDVSTSPIVTELSGRGLGLGIVAEKVDKLGGQVNVVSVLNQGSTFTLTLPLTLATFRGVYVTVAGQKFILPTHNVEKVLRIEAGSIRTAENRDTIIIEGRSFSFIHLADLLGTKLPAVSKNTLYVLIVNAAKQTIAFGVDDVHSEQEILVKGLGKQLIRVRNIMAATVTETGSVVPILNPVDLIKSAVRMDIKSSLLEKINEEQPVKKSILLIEDSITTRLLLKNILTSANYEVKTSVDGVEALEILQGQTFDLIITDIEMPRMDGFTLLEKVRDIPNMKETPFIICTALGSSQDRQRGIELGASAYLDKSTFNFESFVGIVQKLI